MAFFAPQPFSSYQPQQPVFGTFGGFGGFGGSGAFDQFNDPYGGGSRGYDSYALNDPYYSSGQQLGGYYDDYSSGYSLDLDPIGYADGFQNLNLGYSFDNKPRRYFEPQGYRPYDYPIDDFGFLPPQQLQAPVPQPAQKASKEEKKSKKNEQKADKKDAERTQSRQSQKQEDESKKQASTAAAAEATVTTTTAAAGVKGFNDPKLVNVDPSYYNRNYIVKPKELDEIRNTFANNKESIDLKEFVSLCAKIAAQPGVEQLAELSFNDADREQKGKLDFDDTLIAYAFVRYRKYGGADLGYTNVAYSNVYEPAPIPSQIFGAFPAAAAAAPFQTNFDFNGLADYQFPTAFVF